MRISKSQLITIFGCISICCQALATSEYLGQDQSKVANAISVPTGAIAYFLAKGE